MKIFTAIGQAARQQAPNARLILQWGAPFGTIAYLKSGMLGIKPLAVHDPVPFILEANKTRSAF